MDLSSPAPLLPVEPVGRRHGVGRRGGRGSSKSSLERSGEGSNESDDQENDDQWMPDRDPRDERGEFATKAQYLLTVIGFTLGNGNFWHFPMAVMKHGGASFVLMYFISMTVFGVPMLYLEMMIGQIAQKGPMRAFQLNFPLLQGVGWAVCSLSFLRAANIALLNSYSLDYAAESLIGISERTTCMSSWNTLACFSPETNMKKCKNESLAYFNGSCITIEERLRRLPAIDLPARQDYRVTLRGLPACYYIGLKVRAEVEFVFASKRSTAHRQLIVFPVVFCFCLVWMFACFCLLRRVRWLGKISLFIVTFSGFLITLFLIYSCATLPRSDVAIQKFFHFSAEPFTNYKAWLKSIRWAQNSLCLGMGGIISLSSYNKRSNDAFSDSIVVVSVAALVSAMSSLSIYIILEFARYKFPFLVWQKRQDFTDYVSLYYVYYPIALDDFKFDELFSFLLYAMLFALGTSTLFGLLVTPISALTDQFKFCRNHRPITIIMLCFIALGMGLVQCTKVGYHIFYTLDVRVLPLMAEVMVAFEILVIALYGPRNFYRDINASIGRKVNFFGQFISPYGLIIRLCQFVICPCLIAYSLYEAQIRPSSNIFKDVMKRQEKIFEGNEDILYALAYLSLLTYPIVIAGIFMAVVKHKCAGKPWFALIRPDPKHPAVRYQVPPAHGCFFGLKPIEVMSSSTEDRVASEFTEKGPNEEPKDGSPRLEF